jgi:hypothetical protein
MEVDTKTWKEKRYCGANRCSQLNIKLMDLLTDTKQDWWQKDLHGHIISQVAKLNTIRVLLSVVMNLDWPLL